MDIRFLIVGAPFVIAFFYTLFWLKKWGAFNSKNNNLPKNILLMIPIEQYLFFAVSLYAFFYLSITIASTLISFF